MRYARLLEDDAIVDAAVVVAFAADETLDRVVAALAELLKRN